MTPPRGKIQSGSWWTGAQGCMVQLEGIWPRGEMPQRISTHASRRSIYLFIYFIIAQICIASGVSCMPALALPC